MSAAGSIAPNPPTEKKFWLPLKAKMPRCAAITTKGDQCSRNAKGGSLYCWQHQGYIGRPASEIPVALSLQPPLPPASPVNNPALPQFRTFPIAEPEFKGAPEYTQVQNMKMIRSVMAQVHPDQKISPEAATLINQLTYPIYLQLRGLDKDALKQRVDELLTPELAKHAKNEINLDKGTIKGNLATLPIEYLIAEMDELGGNVARDENRVGVTFYHLNKAIWNDEELKATFKENKYTYYNLFDSTYTPPGFSAREREDNYGYFRNSLDRTNKTWSKPSHLQLRVALFNYLLISYFSYRTDQVESIGYPSLSRYIDDFLETYSDEMSLVPADWKDTVDLLLSKDLIGDKLKLIYREAETELNQSLYPDLSKFAVGEYL